MKYFFIVQGEGLGHTTQSLALRSILEKNGHSVINTFSGRNFFHRENKLLASVKFENFFSPFFLSSTGKTGINLFTTFLFNLILSPLYIYSILRIAYRIRTSDADVVIVFYDMVGQLGSYFSFSGKPVYSVSHHFFFGHSSFKWPSNRKAEQILLRIHTKLASIGARKKLTLSFTFEPDIEGKKLFVVPPLLRPEILGSKAVTGNHIHIYCLQPGFIGSIVKLAVKFPQMEYRVFLHEFNNDISLPLNVTVSLISGDKFRESMRNCGLVICTAGFETLAEAIYLNKPLIIVPSKGHFEQYCNAIDAQRVNGANVEESFIINDLPSFTGNPAHVHFMQWIRMSEEILLKHIT